MTIGDRLRALGDDVDRYMAIEDREERASWLRACAVELGALARRMWAEHGGAGQRERVVREYRDFYGPHAVPGREDEP